MTTPPPEADSPQDYTSGSTNLWRIITHDAVLHLARADTMQGQSLCASFPPSKIAVVTYPGTPVTTPFSHLCARCKALARQQLQT